MTPLMGSLTVQPMDTYNLRNLWLAGTKADPATKRTTYAIGSTAIDKLTAHVLAETGLFVPISDESEPYATADDMARDIRLNSRLIISRAHSNHELLTVETNVQIRFLHDLYGHCDGDGAGLILGFSPADEYAAHVRHLAHLDRRCEEIGLSDIERTAMRALMYAEFAGQTSDLEVVGSFREVQPASFMPTDPTKVPTHDLSGEPVTDWVALAVA